MYQVQDSTAVLRVHRRLLSRRAGSTPLVSRTVLLLGLTSLFTDISSEMVAAVLPLYLVYAQGFSPLAVGVVDGIYQGGAAIARLAGGFAADRSGRPKAVATVGYGLSALCRVGLLAVGGALAAVSALVAIDRTGKGIRTAPRDALISLSTPPDQLGTAFGVHRALDTTGALLGPLIAFGLLALAPLAFDMVFVVSLCAALIGLGILVLLVRDRPRAVAVAPAPEVSLRRALHLLAAPRFRALVLAGGALGLATASDAFIYLALQRRLGFDISFVPLLYVGTSLVYMTLAVPVGRLADRIGRGRVFLAGYALLGAVYACALVPTAGVAVLVAVLALLGAYYAATDGVLMALGSAVVPTELRASGLSLLSTATGVTRLVASLAFGALWTLAGLSAALVCFGGALVVALIASGLLLRGRREAPAHA